MVGEVCHDAAKKSFAVLLIHVEKRRDGLYNDYISRLIDLLCCLCDDDVSKWFW